MAYVPTATDRARTTLVKIGGANLPGEPNDEANTGIQYTEAIAYPTPHILYTTVGEGCLTLVNYVVSQPNMSQTNDQHVLWQRGNEGEDLSEAQLV